MLRHLARRLTLTALVMGFAVVLPLAPAHAATGSGDDYPYKKDTTQSSDPWGFTKRQCTSFAAWRLSQSGHALDNSHNAWGNASHWDVEARALHETVSRTAEVGSIAQWEGGEKSAYYANGSSKANGTVTAGSQGHVGYVRKVYSDGSVLVESYNLDKSRAYSAVHVKAPRYLYLR